MNEHDAQTGCMSKPHEVVGAPHLQRRPAPGGLVLEEKVADEAPPSPPPPQERRQPAWPYDLALLVERTIMPRRPHGSRRVLSFSVHGAEARFTDGVVANARLARALYPDWRVIVFAAADVPAAALEELASWGAEVRVASSRVVGRQLQLLRLAPLGEVGVSCVCVRDADARLNPREAAAVGEWLASGKAYHAMHEPFHEPDFAYTGLLGARTVDDSPFPPLAGIHADIAGFVNGLDSSTQKKDDMAFLDSYLGETLASASTFHHAAHRTPFPTTTFAGFVGQPMDCACAWKEFTTSGCAHCVRPD